MHRLAVILSTIWLLAISILWFYHHCVVSGGSVTRAIFFLQFWQTGTFGRALFPILVLFFAYGAALVLRRFRDGRWRTPMWRLSPVWIGGAILLSAVLVWNAAAFGRTITSDPRSPVVIPRVLFLSANSYFICQFMLQCSWLAVLTVTLHAFGGIALRVRGKDFDHPLQRFLFRAGVGFLVLSLLLFGLCLLGLYSRWIVAAIAVAAVAADWRQTRRLAIDLYRYRWDVCLPFQDTRVILFLFLLASVAFNLVDLVRPMPIGWDDLTTYMNRARLIGKRGELVPGGFMFPVELVTSIGFRLFDSAQAAMAVSWLGGALSILGIFAFGRRFWSGTAGLIAAAVWYTLPMVGHMSASDLKIDPILFFISLLACWAVMEWLAVPAAGHWLPLASILAAFALSIKITAGFLLLGLLAMATFSFPFRRIRSMLRFKTAALAGLLFLLPLAPWILFNLSTRGWGRPTSLYRLFTSLDPAKIVLTAGETLSPDVIASMSDFSIGEIAYREEMPIPETTLRRIGIEPGQIVRTGDSVELDRYSGYTRGIMKYLAQPWTQTMNTHFHSLHLTIGFLFLGLLPPLLLLRGRKLLADLPARQLLIFAAIYWIAWDLFGRGIPWYGLAGFLPLTLLIGLFVEWEADPGWFHRLAQGLVVLSVAAHMVLLSDRFGFYPVVQYGGGAVNAEEFSRVLYGDYQKAAEMLAADPPEPGNPKRVYRIGTIFPYFLQGDDWRVASDTLLDFFNAIHQEGQDARTVEILKTLGFKYFIFDTTLPTMEPDPRGSLHLKVKKFAGFAEKNLQVLLYNPDKHIVFATYN